ncbi:aminotransferase class I/II-fold pyridoxal phosphate-dependent enzyme [Nonomuraea deserti]|uniref:Aminotransferase class I/II-fold pyridoxal phosphate-dependent enzyme n=1 Tax=Nonomuraea deserti TaxID=1848322 RepID=A0A4R4UQP3_9ACTN|nr:aminotransferase class I/II-fold pyridoxal phosphate-dependent enzyme [Nonomuraea deserti]TDC91434.1 aminotransferase class I/II-fold pyridoxal phosphate-dependent enzyme [Nonomuraea deserti]
MTDWQNVIAGRSKKDLMHSVERAVSTGELEPGQAFPSVRVLARHLGISASTVVAAITELRQRGVIVTNDRRGSTIAPVPPLKLAVTPRPAPSARPPGVDLSHGGPDRALLPTLRSALHAVAEENDIPRLYGQAMIDPDLRNLTLPQLHDLGIDVAPDHVGVTSGALDLIERALLVSCRPGDRIIVEDPGYPDLFDLLRAMGLQAVPVRVDDEGLRPDGVREAMQRGATALIHTPSAQNPFGAGLTDERAGELARVLAEWPDLVVLEDHHLSLVEPARSTLAGRVRRWAVARSVAKSLGPDLRLAIVAADPHLFARVLGRHALGPGWVSHVLQRTVVHVLTDQSIRRQLKHARDTYDARRLALLAELRRKGIEAHGATGLNVWIPVADEGSAALDLAHRGWAVSPGGGYRRTCPPGLRVTTSTLDVSETPRLADDISHALQPRAARRG